MCNAEFEWRGVAVKCGMLLVKPWSAMSLHSVAGCRALVDVVDDTRCCGVGSHVHVGDVGGDLLGLHHAVEPPFGYVCCIMDFLLAHWHRCQQWTTVLQLHE